MDQEIGSMAMPADFKYRDVHRMGRPRHKKYSEFWCRHIPMDPAHRAKIFAPFDALRGFSDAIEARKTVPVNRRRPDTDELNRMLSRLLHCRGTVSVRYFIPGGDPDADAAGESGQGHYETISGNIWEVDPVSQVLRIGRHDIPFEDIGELVFDDPEPSL